MVGGVAQQRTHARPFCSKFNTSLDTKLGVSYKCNRDDYTLKVRSCHVNSRFAVATHVLAYLEYAKGQPATSEEIAASVNTNPVVVRRILGILRKAGLTQTQFGVGGGALLARPGNKITLLDAYEAIEEGADLFALSSLSPSAGCDVGANIQATLEKLFGGAEQALKRALAEVTIEQVLSEAQARSRCRK